MCSALPSVLIHMTSFVCSTGQWRQCCDDVMKIELPSPRKPAPITPKQGSLYHEMGKCEIVDPGCTNRFDFFLFFGYFYLWRKKQEKSSVVACDRMNKRCCRNDIFLCKMSNSPCFPLCSVDRRGLIYDSLTQHSVLFLFFSIHSFLFIHRSVLSLFPEKYTLHSHFYLNIFLYHFVSLLYLCIPELTPPSSFHKLNRLLHPFIHSFIPSRLVDFPKLRWQRLLPHPPARVFCCRITLCLLRFVLCSHPITATGEVAGVGLPQFFRKHDVPEGNVEIYCDRIIQLLLRFKHAGVGRFEIKVIFVELNMDISAEYVLKYYSIFLLLSKNKSTKYTFLLIWM